MRKSPTVGTRTPQAWSALWKRNRTMIDVNDARSAKARELRELARQFRSKADQTQLARYADLMRRSASELEQLADQLEAALASVIPDKR